MSQEQIFFFGEFEHAVDPQCRLALPSEWRNKNADTRLVLLPGRDSDLQLLPFETFQQTMEKAGRFAVANQRLQAAFAYIGSRARHCKCDKQGRIGLDRAMLDEIGVTNQLKLIGAITYIRLCSPENWKTPSADLINSYWDEIQKLSENEGK